MLAATRVRLTAFGFSDETSEVMKPKPSASSARPGVSTRTPRQPTTTASPARTRCMGTMEHGALPPWRPTPTTRAQSISGRPLAIHRPSTRTQVARLVVE